MITQIDVRCGNRTASGVEKDIENFFHRISLDDGGEWVADIKSMVIEMDHTKPGHWKGRATIVPLPERVEANPRRLQP